MTLDRGLRLILQAIGMGTLLGALLIGGGSRLVMRLLTQLDQRQAGFTLGGTLEIIAYGAIVGAAGGLLYLVVERVAGSRYVRGILSALLLYGATILTLPAHIAQTAEPFRDVMPLVILLFGLCFVAFGLAIAAWTGAIRDQSGKP